MIYPFVVPAERPVDKLTQSARGRLRARPGSRRSLGRDADDPDQLSATFTELSGSSTPKQR